MVHIHKIEDDNKQIKAITNIGIAINLILSVIKIVGGLFANSMALVADGIHSVTDIVTDVTVLIGVHFGSKQADPKHPYGHGRIETFSAAIIASVLVAVGLGMVYKAGISIAEADVRKPGMPVLFIALISIVAKEILYRVTKKVAIASHSSALYANAWHHRSDAFSSIAVAIGFVSVILGFKYGDHIAAIAVGIMIILVGWHIIADCFHEFTESAVDQGTIDNITNIINANSSIRQWHKLRSRTVGREVFLDLHILVDPNLSISAAHSIA